MAVATPLEKGAPPPWLHNYASVITGRPGPVPFAQAPFRIHSDRQALVGDVDLVQRRIGGGGVELDRSRNRERLAS